MGLPIPLAQWGWPHRLPNKADILGGLSIKSMHCATHFLLRQISCDEVLAFKKMQKVVTLCDQLVRLLGRDIDPNITSQILAEILAQILFLKVWLRYWPRYYFSNYFSPRIALSVRPMVTFLPHITCTHNYLICERAKGTKDKVKKPTGPSTRSRAGDP